MSLRVLDKSQGLQKPAYAVSEVCGQIDNRVREIESKLQDCAREIREAAPKYRLPQVDVMEISFMDLYGKLSCVVEARQSS